MPKKHNDDQTIEVAEASDCRLIRVPLSKIKGLHETIEATLVELAIPPLRLPVQLAKSDPQFRDFLSRCQIMVFRDNRLLRCIGNVRIFQAAKFALDPEFTVECIERYGLTPELIKSQFLAELFYLPVASGIDFREIKIIAEVARRASVAGLWMSPQSSVDNYIARLFNVDRRQFLAKRGPKTDTSAEISDPAKTEQPVGHPRETGSRTEDLHPRTTDMASPRAGPEPNREVRPESVLFPKDEVWQLWPNEDSQN